MGLTGLGYSTSNGMILHSAQSWSIVTLGAAATRQLSARVALGITPAVSQYTDCVEPTCDWKSRDASVGLRVVVRPLWWLTLRAVPSVGVRYRPDLLLPVIYPDGTTIPIQPRTVTFMSLSGWLDFSS